MDCLPGILNHCINQKYIISADQCHIRLITGKWDIIKLFELYSGLKIYQY